MSLLPPVSVFVLDVCGSSLAFGDEGMLSPDEQQRRVGELLECLRCGVLEYAYLTRPQPEVQNDNQQPLSVILLVSNSTDLPCVVLWDGEAQQCFLSHFVLLTAGRVDGC